MKFVEKPKFDTHPTSQVWNYTLKVGCSHPRAGRGLSQQGQTSCETKHFSILCGLPIYFWIQECDIQPAIAPSTWMKSCDLDKRKLLMLQTLKGRKSCHKHDKQLWKTPRRDKRRSESGRHTRLERRANFPYSSQLSINNGFLSFSPCFPDNAGTTGRKTLVNHLVSRRQRLLKKGLLKENTGSDLGVNFSQGFLLKKVFFPAMNSEGFFFSSCSLLLLQQNAANTFHFLSCLVGCWGDVISELLYVSAGPYLQQNLWYMPVPPAADWIWPGKWRKPQLTELQKMNFT